MTVTLDLSPLIAGRVSALARAQNRPVADVLNDAVTELYAKSIPFAENGSEEAIYYLPDPSEGAPSTEADARAVQEAFQDFDAGDRGTSPAESFAKLAAKYSFKNPVL